MNHKILICIVILNILVKFGVGLECYVDQCSDTGAIGNKCLGLQKISSQSSIGICGSSEVCIKQISRKTKINNIEIPVITTRICGPTEYCEQLKQISQSCSYCDKDLCNGGTAIMPSVIIFILYIFKYFIL